MSDMDMEDDGSGIVKKFMFLNRKAPHGTVYALEGLEVVLITAAFDQDVSLVFTDDGVYQLMKGVDEAAQRKLNAAAPQIPDLQRRILALFRPYLGRIAATAVSRLPLTR